MTSLFDMNDGLSREERFAEFHAANPHVLELLIGWSREVKAAGFKRYSLEVLWQKLRWYYTIERRQGDFKLNDHLRSLYSRKVMAECPDLKGFFETRDRKAA